MRPNEKTNDSNLKIAVLSLSMLTVLAGAAVSPALGAIGKYFSNDSETLIRLIVSIPALFIAITSIFMNKVINKYKIKNILIVGLLLYILGGICGGLVNNIYLLLLCRAILGIGTGIIVPLSLGLIPYLFKENEQIKLMGYSSAFNNIGGIIATITSGLLISFSWRVSFLVYIIGVIPLILVIMYIPDINIKREKANLDKDSFKKIRKYIVAIFLMMVTFYVFPTNFAIFATSEKLLKPSFIGIAMSVATLSALLVGIFLEKLNHIFKTKLKYVGSISLSIGFVILIYSKSIGLIVIALFLIGLGNGVMMPLINSKVSKSVKKEDATAAMSMITMGLYIGQFISPILVGVIQNITGNFSSTFPFVIASLLGLVLVIMTKTID